MQRGHVSIEDITVHVYVLEYTISTRVPYMVRTMVRTRVQHYLKNNLKYKQALRCNGDTTMVARYCDITL